jgi:hypothetical protein
VLWVGYFWDRVSFAQGWLQTDPPDLFLLSS